MRVLITGSSSIIGCAVSDALLDRGDHVVAVDVQAATTSHPNLTPIEADVRNPAALRDAAQDCDVGLHLAARSGDTSELELASVNMLGALSFCMAARDADWRIAVLAGSAPVHLPPGALDNHFINDSRAADAYDRSKCVQELIAADFHVHRVPTFVLRFGHVVYGARGENLDTPTPLRQLDYCRGGWVALEDVVTGCLAALDTEADPTFQIYNLVGSREGQSRFDVARTTTRLGISLAYDFAGMASRHGNN